MRKIKQFVFISGCDRSGTTALVRLLNSHNEICIGMERYKGLIRKEKIHTLTQERFQYENFFNIKDEETNIQWDYFYDPLKEKYNNCSIVGDKVPRYFQNFNHLKENFPQAKHIFLIRDPYEVASSWKVRAQDKSDVNWVSSNDVKRAVNIWNKSLESVYKEIKNNSVDVVIVSYNKLFSGNELELKKITNHLNLDLTQELSKKFEETTSSWDKHSNKKLVITDSERKYIENNANFNLSIYIQKIVTKKMSTNTGEKHHE